MNRAMNRAMYSMCIVVGICLIIGILFFLFFQMIREYKENERYGYAVEDLGMIPAYQKLDAFLDENKLIAQEEIVIATHPDFGFLFNAMTGRNILVDRITHANPFVDPDKRAADMAVILFGNNRTKAVGLIKEYNVKYLFLEKNSLVFKARCMDNWNETKTSRKKDKTILVYWCMQTSPNYKKYLSENGIETITAYVRLAAGDKNVPLKKVLVIEAGEIRLETKIIFQEIDEEGNPLLQIDKITEV